MIETSSGSDDEPGSQVTTRSNPFDNGLVQTQPLHTSPPFVDMVEEQGASSTIREREYSGSQGYSEPQEAFGRELTLPVRKVNFENKTEVRDPLQSSPHTHLRHSEQRHFVERFDRLTLAEPEPGLRVNDYFGDRRYTPEVDRWGLQFDGKTGLSDFLERLEECRVARGASKGQTFASAPELLTGKTLVWYGARKGYFRDYDGFIAELEKSFRPCDYGLQLWEEIKSRTQGRTEKVVLYFSAMEGLFRRLPEVVPETTRIKWIRRNLQPYFQEKLITMETRTVWELEELFCRIEEVQRRVEMFRSPRVAFITSKSQT